MIEQVALEMRQSPVEQVKVNAALHLDSHLLFGGRHAGDVVPLPRQDQSDKLAGVCVVFHEQDFQRRLYTVANVWCFQSEL